MDDAVVSILDDQLNSARYIEENNIGEVSQEEWVARQKEAQREHFARLLESAGVPPIYRDAKLATNCQIYADEAGKAKALGYATHLVENGKIIQRDATKFCLLLTGDFGGGKTWLGTAVFKELLWKAKAGTWRKFHVFIREMQDTYGKNNTFEVLQRFQKSKVLMLDDAGDLNADETHDRRRLFHELIDYRNDWMLPTVITTNLGQDEMIEQFGERVWNRLVEMCAMVSMKGRNLRMDK